MRLSEFMVDQMEAILAEFESFARTHTTAGAEMDMRALRDHAAEMLSTIAADLNEPQTNAEQKQKSKGDAPDGEAGLTPAEQHGTDRAGSGFTLEEMFSEYRALRASVLRLWSAARGQPDEADMQDLIRFNEAIDQALAESIRRYSTSIGHSREMFLAILGHDLRTPISAVVTAAGFMESGGHSDAEQIRMSSLIRRSGERMSRLVDDLLGFTLSRLGRGIPVERADADAGEIARAALDETAAAHPTSEIRFESSGDLRGCWDVDRIKQVIGNVIGNAVQHGAKGAPITVSAHGDGDEVTLVVHNEGTMPSEERRRIFDPFHRLTPDATAGTDRRSMGLGLYITEQIVIAHGGHIDVDSSPEAGTTFTIHLPRGL